MCASKICAVYTHVDMSVFNQLKLIHVWVCVNVSGGMEICKSTVTGGQVDMT